MSKTRILFLDIETAPNAAYVWGLFDQNIAPNQVETASYVLCWAAKWQGERTMYFSSIQELTSQIMLTRIHDLLDEADIVVHYNGNKFDIPTLNKEFVKHGMLPPSPSKQIDMLSVCRRAFRFESNKLDSITKALGIGSKVKHHGFELWLGCMRNDKRSWKIMERYNRMDVTLLEKVYHRLLPWISKHPTLHGGSNLSCPKCNSLKTQQRGLAFTKTGRFKRYQCMHCGGWFRSSTPVAKIPARGVNL